MYISIHATFEPTSFPDFPFLHSVSFRVVPGRKNRVFVQESYEEKDPASALASCVIAPSKTKQLRARPRTCLVIQHRETLHPDAILQHRHTWTASPPSNASQQPPNHLPITTTTTSYSPTHHHVSDLHPQPRDPPPRNPPPNPNLPPHPRPLDPPAHNPHPPAPRPRPDPTPPPPAPCALRPRPAPGAPPLPPRPAPPTRLDPPVPHARPRAQHLALAHRRPAHALSPAPAPGARPHQPRHPARGIHVRRARADPVTAGCREREVETWTREEAAAPAERGESGEFEYSSGRVCGQGGESGVGGDEEASHEGEVEGWT